MQDDTTHLKGVKYTINIRPICAYMHSPCKTKYIVKKIYCQCNNLERKSTQEMIPFTFIDKLNNLTNCEMDMILWLLERKNSQGLVGGVRVSMFKEMMAKQSFYNALDGLQNKEIINVKHNKNTGDHDIFIYGCSDDDCVDESGKARYINLNRELFKSAAFKNLTSRAKYMVLDFYVKTSVKINASGTKATHEKYMNEFYEKYINDMKRTKRRIRQYLHNLKEFFNITLKKGKSGWKYIIGRAKMMYALDKKTADVATKQRRKHFVQAMFGRYRLKATDNAINDVAALYITYKPENESIFDV